MKQIAIERLLPEVFQQTLRPGNALSEILAVMERLHQPAEQALDSLDSYFSPYRAPDGFVLFLAQWMNLDRYFPSNAGARKNMSEFEPPISTGMGRLRELIKATIDLSRWRGTSKGLQLFLVMATDEDGFQIDEKVVDTDDFPRPFHICVHAPKSVDCHRTLITRIIEQEKPAYVTFDLKFDVNVRRKQK